MKLPYDTQLAMADIKAAMADLKDNLMAMQDAFDELESWIVDLQHAEQEEDKND